MLIDHTTNDHLFTDHAITQKPFDYSAMPQQAICSICDRLGDADAMVSTYANPLHQSMKIATKAHDFCARERAAEIANFRAEGKR